MSQHSITFFAARGTGAFRQEMLCYSRNVYISIYVPGCSLIFIFLFYFFLFFGGGGVTHIDLYFDDGLKGFQKEILYYCTNTKEKNVFIGLFLWWWWGGYWGFYLPTNI